jgi:hypothetical protein
MNRYTMLVDDRNTTWIKRSKNITSHVFTAVGAQTVLYNLLCANQEESDASIFRVEVTSEDVAMLYVYRAQKCG